MPANQNGKSARNGGPNQKKSKGSKKANGAAQKQLAISYFSTPSSAQSQMRSGVGSSYAPVQISSQQRVRGAKEDTKQAGRMIVVRKREFIMSLVGSTALAVTKLSVNPGLAAVFPWLSTQAPQWEQYRFRKLVFEYITRTATTSVGSVILSPDYDPADLTPTTEAQITAYEDAVEDAPWKNISCIIKCANINPGPRKFIRQGAVAGDIKNYDALNLFIGTVDFAGATPSGKIWVDYEVELYIPQNSPGDDTNPTNVSYFRRAASQLFATTVNEAIDWDAASSGNDPLGIGNDVLGVFTPPRGVYKVEYGASFTDTIGAPEVFTALLTSFKNGAASGPESTEILIAQGDTASVSGSDIIRMNGTDTFQVMVNLTGAAGVLTYRANTAYLMWSVV